MSNLLPVASTEAARELSTLNEQKCSLITASYGNELVLGFGSTRPADRPLRDTRIASWMLYTRSTPWELETPRGVVATDRRRLGPITLRQIEEAVLDVDVRATEIRNSAQALTIYFANRAEFSLKPTAPEVRRGGTSIDVWELHMPDSRVVRGSADGQLQLMHGDQELPELQASEYEREPLAALRIADAEPPPVALRSETATSRANSLDFWRWLRGVVTSLGYELFEPSVQQDTGIDAIVLGPEGKIVAIEYKHGLTDAFRFDVARHVRRLLVVTDEPSTPGRVKRLMANARIAGLQVAQVSWVETATAEAAATFRSLMES